VKREYEEAFAEVDEILQLMPPGLLIKIPLQFQKIISEKKAKDYKPNLKEPIEEEQLKYETRVILGLMYRDFLVTPEEREELQAKDAEELRIAEEKLKQQYDTENLFKKRKSSKFDENIDFPTDMIIYKEIGFLQKIFNFIKGIFNRNKIWKKCRILLTYIILFAKITA